MNDWAAQTGSVMSWGSAATPQGQPAAGQPIGQPGPSRSGRPQPGMMQPLYPPPAQAPPPAAVVAEAPPAPHQVWMKPLIPPAPPEPAPQQTWVQPLGAPATPPAAPAHHPAQAYQPSAGSYQPPAYHQGLRAAPIQLPPSRLRGPAVTLYVALGLMLPGAVLLAAAYGWQWTLLQHLATVSLQDAKESDGLITLALMVTALPAWVAGITTLVWFHRVRGNADYVGAAMQRHTRKWAVLGWMIPIVNLAVPPRIANDALLEMKYANADPLLPRRRTGDPVVRWWWATLLLAAVPWNLAYHEGFSLSSRSSLAAGAALLLVAHVALTLALVRKITAAQRRVLG